MKGRYILFAALMFVVCIFGGCSSAVSVGMSVLPDGTIRQTFSVVLDAKELSQKYDADDVEKIYSTVYEYLDNYKTRVNALASSYMAEKGMVNRYPWKSSISPSENGGMTPSGQITCYVLFYSSYFYDEYLNYIGSGSGGESGDDDADAEPTTKKGWLFDTIIYQDTTLPIADLEQIQSVYDQIKTSLSAQGVELNEDVKLANLSYDYAVPYSYAQVNRIKSNADREYTQSEKQLNADGSVASEYSMKHFVWNYDPDGENRLVLYRYRIHSVAWYILALVLVVVFGAIMILCNFISKKKNARKADANIAGESSTTMQNSFPQNESESVDNPQQKITHQETKIEKMNNFFENIDKNNKNNPQ